LELTESGQSISFEDLCLSGQFSIFWCDVIIQVRKVVMDMFIAEEEYMLYVLFQQCNKSTTRNQKNYGQDHHFLNQMVVLGGIKIAQDLHIINVSQHLLDITWPWDPAPSHSSKPPSGSRRVLFILEIVGKFMCKQWRMSERLLEGKQCFLGAVMSHPYQAGLGIHGSRASWSGLLEGTGWLQEGTDQPRERANRK
jgi:hypothetical protein